MTTKRPQWLRPLGIIAEIARVRIYARVNLTVSLYYCPLTERI
jgi:hypothetical protein